MTVKFSRYLLMSCAQPMKRRLVIADLLWHNAHMICVFRISHLVSQLRGGILVLPWLTSIGLTSIGLHMCMVFGIWLTCIWYLGSRVLGSRVFGIWLTWYLVSQYELELLDGIWYRSRKAQVRVTVGVSFCCHGSLARGGAEVCRLLGRRLR